jgi:hypothetical protein
MESSTIIGSYGMAFSIDGNLQFMIGIYIEVVTQTGFIKD